MSHIRQQTAKDLQAEGKPLPRHPAFAVIDLLPLNTSARARRRVAVLRIPGGRGQKHLWPELKSRFEKPGQQISPQDVRDRLLFIQAIEKPCAVWSGGRVDVDGRCQRCPIFGIASAA